MTPLLLLLALTLCCTLCLATRPSASRPFAKAWRVVNSIAVASAFAYVPMVHAKPLTPTETIAATKAIESVERVANSLTYIQQDIENKGGAQEIVGQIKFLVRNYKLSDNINSAIVVVPKEGSKAALEHGRAAVEDLAAVYEYYSEEMDNMSGKKTPAKETLVLADKAVAAARKELGFFLEACPQAMVHEVELKLAAEIAGTSS